MGWLEVGARPLAALRIAVAATWLTLPALWAGPALAALPVQQAPWGAAWLLPWVTPAAVTVARALTVPAALAALVGWHARPAFAIMAVAGGFVLTALQTRGGVQHLHHLVWFAALLAVSPCEDAWSVRSPRPTPGRTRGWGVPTWLAWAMLAAIYLFPGLHKLRVQGLGWAGDSLRWTLSWKLAQAWDFTPLVRLDAHPGWLHAGGLAVLALEVGAPLAMLHPASRLGFALAALAFHAATAAFFDIHFGVLAACLVVLVPDRAAGPGPERSWRPAAVVGGALLVGIVGTGAAGLTQAWPFACYPTFEQPIGPWMPTLAVVAVGADGHAWLVDERALADADRSQVFYGEAWAITGRYGPVAPGVPAAFWARTRQRPAVRAAVADAVRVRLVAAERHVGTGALRLGDLVVELAP